MFYDFDESRGGFILAKKEILFVPEFKALYEGFGWNAIQYLFFFTSPISPYFYSEPAQRDIQTRQSIDKDAWEEGRKLPDRLYESPLYVMAAKEFEKRDEQLEARQESALRKLRADALDYMANLDITKPVDRKEISELLGTLDTLSKQHRENRKAMVERLSTDDSPAITMHDIKSGSDGY